MGALTNLSSAGKLGVGERSTGFGSPIVMELVGISGEALHCALAVRHFVSIGIEKI